MSSEPRFSYAAHTTIPRKGMVIFMDQFQIANITISVLWENEEQKDIYYRYHDCIIMPRILEAFRAKELHAETDLTVSVRTMKPYTGPIIRERVYNETFYREDGKIILTIFNPYHLEVPGYSLSMSEDYADVVYTPHIKEYENYDLQFVMIPFEGRVLQKGGVVLHGAAVEHLGKGIIFTGVSGAGKSTQAHLWQKYRNALILNGDCPVIRLDKGKPRIYGTPWCGTSGEAINRNTELSSVVLVKQGEKSALRRLEGQSAYLAVLANVFRSNNDVSAVDLAISNLKSIVEQIQVFELTCTISEDAVKLLENEIT
jgi:hypothetical protein